MSRTTKLLLDILLGAVVPILVLSRLSEPLGAVPAYLLAALIPVGWVAIDLLFITRRFNFITGFLGLNALVRGILAFWFVDGLLYALKDTAGGALSVAIFAGSLCVGRPIMQAFTTQSLDPQGPEQERSLGRLFDERPVARALALSTAILAAVFLVTSVANFLLNLAIVTAPFGTGAFNAQVAQVNAITRVALAVPEFAAWAVALWLVFRAIYARLPGNIGDADFWDLVREREDRQDREPRTRLDARMPEPIPERREGR